MPEEFLMFEEMNMPAAADGYVPDNRYVYIRPTTLATIIPGSEVVHKFYLTDPNLNNTELIARVDVQYAFGPRKLFIKQAELEQLNDACEVTVILSEDDTDYFIVEYPEEYPELQTIRKSYLSAYCQLLLYVKVDQSTTKLIKSEIYEINVELPLNKYYERILEEDDT